MTQITKPLRQKQLYPAGNTLRRPAGTRLKRARKRRRKILILYSAGLITGLFLLFAAAASESPLPHSLRTAETGIPADGVSGNTDAAEYLAVHGDVLPEELQKLLSLNSETLDFVKSYPQRDILANTPIDLSGDFTAGQVPLLMQWDTRWGYNDYGDSIIAISGCGPVCLDMAYLYFTADTSMTPREMSEFVRDGGYCTPMGTAWSLWTEGVEKLGLSGRELSLDEHVMHRALDDGGLIVCSMGPGDFTTQGHFILIWGYDENGFYVNDPNRRSNSGKQWDFDTLQYQIKNLWKINASPLT